MAVVAITRIQFGKGQGEVENIGVGDDISDLPEDVLESLVLGGSAVETGKNRKFSSVPGAGGPADEETVLRDSLIAKANSGVDDSHKSVASNEGTNAKTPGGPSATSGTPQK